MFNSFGSRITAARRDKQLFFAPLISAEAILSIFGDASEILDSARIYNTCTLGKDLYRSVVSLG